MRIVIDDFINHKSNTLQGFFTIYLPELGISIPGFSLHESAAGARWIELPSKKTESGTWERVLIAYNLRQAKKFKEDLLKAVDAHRQGTESRFQIECQHDFELN